MDAKKSRFRCDWRLVFEITTSREQNNKRFKKICKYFLRFRLPENSGFRKNQQLTIFRLPESAKKYPCKVAALRGFFIQLLRN
jgi:hypothetical protein|nr:MAG TPA: hypothetical protein [Caudoviricetes sp.]DAO43692.1 MAG TPA: hypothetical protein [Caudoviricetes sp.]DAT92767.1 MAG TPA: hypothetical protein [Caudoviricetes sp.]